MTQHISLIAKASSQAIILTVISLFIIPFASSIDFSIDIPDEMALSQDIDVGISAPNESDYDIKIFFESDGSEIPGEIDTDDGWKSTRFYIQDISFKVKTFVIRLKEPASSIDNLSVCVRLRLASSSSTPNKQCSDIDIVEAESDEEETDESDSESSSDDGSDAEEVQDEDNDSESEDADSADEADDEDEKEDEEGKEEVSAPKSGLQSKSKAPQQVSSSKDSESTEPIILKNLAEEVKYTGAGKSRIIMNYIIALTVLVALFLLLRSEQQYREI